MGEINSNNNVYARRQGEIPELRSFYSKQKPKIRENYIRVALIIQDERRASRC